MTRIVSSYFNQKWYIETAFDDPDQYLHLFDNLQDNRSKTTATNNGTQHYFSNGEDLEITDVVRNYCNTILTDFNAPMRAGELFKAWAIKYGPGGWQALHNHAVPGEILSCILYFDTNEQEDTSDGAFYACLPEPDGSQIVKACPYWKGKLLIVEGSVYHGAYPTTTERKVIVLDYKQEK